MSSSNLPPSQQRQQQKSPRLVVATTATASEHRLPFVSLMNQSTIYRRHEARLSKSYALKDDPRPAPIRVLSGLPGFRMIVPPYQGEQSPQHANTEPSPRIGDYSEATVFSTSDDEQQRQKHDNRIATCFTTQQQVLQAMLATLAAGVVGEYLFGSHHVVRQNALSPFANHQIKQPGGNSAYSPFLRANGDSLLGVYLLKERQPGASAAATASAKPSARMAAAAAASTSLLFVSKVLLEQSLKETTNDNSLTKPTFLLSSALAGGVVGGANVAASAVTTCRHSSMPSAMRYMPRAGPQALIGRHMLASTLYFATYEGVSSCFTTTSDNNNNKTTAQILTAGALAGSVQATVLHSSKGMVSAATRAAPIHAMVFLTYESMKEGLERK